MQPLCCHPQSQGSRFLVGRVFDSATYAQQGGTNRASDGHARHLAGMRLVVQALSRTGLSLLIVYLIWASVVITLYPLCRWLAPS